MLRRTLTLVLALLLASSGFGAATGAPLQPATAISTDESDSSPVSIEKDQENKTVVVQVSSCEGHLCGLGTTFTLYVAGEKVEKLAYGEDYRVENESYTNKSVNISVAKTAFSGDTGWAYNVTRRTTENQSATDPKQSPKGNQSGGNETTTGQPSTVVNVEELDDFGSCMEQDHWKLMLPRTPSEGDYCYDQQFN